DRKKSSAAKENRKSLRGLCIRTVDARRGGDDRATRRLAETRHRHRGFQRRFADRRRSHDRPRTNWIGSPSITSAERAEAPTHRFTDSPRTASLRLCARKRSAGFPLRRERAQWRLSANGRNTDDANCFRRLPRRVRRIENLFSWPQFYGKSARRHGV